LTGFTAFINNLRLHFVHLTVDVPHSHNCDQEGDRQDNIADNFALCVLRTIRRLFKNYAKVDGYELLRQWQQSCEREHDYSHTTGREYGRGKMPRNGAQASNQCNLEATIPNYFSEASISYFGAFQLFSACSTTVLESIKVSNLSQERPSSNNAETDPQSPN
jgi:hypothetical protein